MTQKRVTITEREKQAVKWIAGLSDKELFGLECFLAGIRMKTKQNQMAVNQSHRKMNGKGTCTEDE